MAKSSPSHSNCAPNYVWNISCHARKYRITDTSSQPTESLIRPNKASKYQFNPEARDDVCTAVQSDAQPRPKTSQASNGELRQRPDRHAACKAARDQYAQQPQPWIYSGRTQVNKLGTMLRTTRRARDKDTCEANPTR